MLGKLNKPVTAINFEANLAQRAHNSERVAWVVAGVSLVVTVLSIATLLMVLPLKQTVPYLIYVDKATGVTQVVDVATPSKISQDEANARHWVHAYVLARERYVYKLLQSDYDFVMATSAIEQQKEFARQYEPGPNKKDDRLRDQVEERIKIQSVQLVPGDSTKATVRYTREVWRSGSREPDRIEALITDLAFTWIGVKGWDDKTLLINPLGFNVQAYRTSAEAAPR